MAENFGNHAESHSQRSVNFANREATTGYCACGKRSMRGGKGFCGDECRFWAKVTIGPHCWLWNAGRHIRGDKDDSYGQVYYKGRPRRAHIVSWALSHGGILPEHGLSVCHTCDVPLCVRPDHLFLGTQQENLQDASRKGRLSIPRPGRQKVSPTDIAEMRLRVGLGETHASIARYFGISRSTVTEIIQGKRRRYDAPLSTPIEKAS